MRGDRDDQGLRKASVAKDRPLGLRVIAVGNGRRLRRLHDIPALGAPVELAWRQRRSGVWSRPACPVGGFSER